VKHGPDKTMISTFFGHHQLRQVTSSSSSVVEAVVVVGRLTGVVVRASDL